MDIIDLLDTAENDLNYVSRNSLTIPASEIYKKVCNIQSYIKDIQIICRRMAQISNSLNEFVLYKDSSDNKYVEINQLVDDNKISDSRKKFSKNKISVVDNSPEIEVINIDDEKDLPFNYIYRLSGTGEFCINLNGYVLKSDICEIKSSEKSIICQYGVTCKHLLNTGKCKFYHHPDDYVSLNKPIEDEKRALPHSSWLYNPRNKISRHLRDPNTIRSDILLMGDHDEESIRTPQLITDILMYIMLKQCKSIKDEN